MNTNDIIRHNMLNYYWYPLDASKQLKTPDGDTVYIDSQAKVRTVKRYNNLQSSHNEEIKAGVEKAFKVATDILDREVKAETSLPKINKTSYAELLEQHKELIGYMVDKSQLNEKIDEPVLTGLIKANNTINETRLHLSEGRANIGILCPDHVQKYIKKLRASLSIALMARYEINHIYKDKPRDFTIPLYIATKAMASSGNCDSYGVIAYALYAGKKMSDGERVTVKNVLQDGRVFHAVSTVHIPTTQMNRKPNKPEGEAQGMQEVVMDAWKYGPAVLYEDSSLNKPHHRFGIRSQCSNAVEGKNQYQVIKGLRRVMQHPNSRFSYQHRLDIEQPERLDSYHFIASTKQYNISSIFLKRCEEQKINMLSYRRCMINIMGRFKRAELFNELRKTVIIRELVNIELKRQSLPSRCSIKEAISLSKTLGTQPGC